MSSFQKTLIITAGIIVFVLIGGCSYVGGKYNGLVKRQESVKSAWAEVGNQAKRRFDLIPNLVETVKGYAGHEKSLFVAVTEARAKVGQVNIKGLPNVEQLEQFNKTQDGLGASLSRLLVVQERYPELKADKNFLALQEQLEGTENRLAYARREYNNSAQGFNTYRLVFPNNIFAGIFNVSEAVYTEFEEVTKTAPAVEFN